MIPHLMKPSKTNTLHKKKNSEYRLKLWFQEDLSVSLMSGLQY